MTEEEISNLIIEHLIECPITIRLTKFLATFVNNYGLLSEFNVIYEILQKIADQGRIKIIRKPSTTKNNKPTKFWEELSQLGDVTYEPS